jgi:hypothetical protein
LNRRGLDYGLAWRIVRGKYRKARQGLLWPLRRRAIERHLEVLSGAGTHGNGPTDCVVTTLVRDNEHIVEPFLEHCLALGAARIVLLDNGSQDSTVARAQRYERVTILRCTLPFHVYEPDMKRFLIERYAEGRWCLAADVDELFDYPGSDRLPFAGFLRYLDEHRYTAVAALLLDLFADGPLPEWPEGGRAMIEACVWYDPAGFRPWRFPWLRRANRFADPNLPLYEGGIREQLFGRRTITTKFPLLRYQRDGGLNLRSLEHTIEGGHVADVSAVLRHYKFDRAFLERWRMAAERGRHRVHIKDHRAASVVAEQNPQLVLRGPAARRLAHVNQLVDEGLLSASRAYWDWVQSWPRADSGSSPGR